MKRLLQSFGASLLLTGRLAGALGLLTARTLLSLPRLNRRETLRTTVLFGVRSLPLCLGVATLIGATVVLQAGVYAERFGARQYVGWAAGYGLIWEFGPLLLGIMMTARIGARNAAELALLTINGQVDGLRGVALDPFALLIAPRVIATTLSVVTLSTLTFLMAVGWEVVAASLALHLPPRVFLSAFMDMLWWGDLVGGVLKTLAFGLAIALVSTTAGLRARGGARGVGRAAAGAVLGGCSAVFGLDFALTPLLSGLSS